MSEMRYPTIVIQLTTDEGFPVDMPDDLMEAAVAFAKACQEAWHTGADVVFGMVERQVLLDAENQVGDEN